MLLTITAVVTVSGLSFEERGQPAHTALLAPWGKRGLQTEPQKTQTLDLRKPVCSQLSLLRKKKKLCNSVLSSSIIEGSPKTTHLTSAGFVSTSHLNSQTGIARRALSACTTPRFTSYSQTQVILSYDVNNSWFSDTFISFLCLPWPHPQLASQ